MRSGDYNYSSLTNCTRIDGSLILSDRATIFQQGGEGGRGDYSALSKWFEAIEEVTLQLSITDTPLKSLSFLSRLKKIGSRMEDESVSIFSMFSIIVTFKQLSGKGNNIS